MRDVVPVPWRDRVWHDSGRQQRVIVSLWAWFPILLCCESNVTPEFQHPRRYGGKLGSGITFLPIKIFYLFYNKLMQFTKCVEAITSFQERAVNLPLPLHSLQSRLTHQSTATWLFYSPGVMLVERNLDVDWQEDRMKQMWIDGWILYASFFALIWLWMLILISDRHHLLDTYSTLTCPKKGGVLLHLMERFYLCFTADKAFVLENLKYVRKSKVTFVFEDMMYVCYAVSTSS